MKNNTINYIYTDSLNDAFIWFVCLTVLFSPKTSKMNSYIVCLIISIAVACLSLLTRIDRKFEQQESNMVLFLRMFIITYACSYLAITFLIAPTCPDIDMGEPDF